MKGVLFVYKDIPSLPGYSISPDGIIKNNGTKEIFIGYLDHKSKKLRIKIGGKIEYIHRLVAETYLPNENDYEFVIHKNGVLTDNRVENLKWSSRSDIQIQAYDSGKKHEHCGIPKPVRIKELNLYFETISDCANYLNVDPSLIRQQLKGQITTCKGYTIQEVTNNTDIS